jgi:hypothetical protein
MINIGYKLIFGIRKNVEKGYIVNVFDNFFVIAIVMMIHIKIWPILAMK